MTNIFSRLKHFNYLLFPLISGILVGTSFPPFSSWALTFCWVPLWFSLSEEQSLKRVFQKAWVTQFILSLIGFYWIAYTGHAFGDLPWAVSVLALLLFAAFMHLHIPASLLLARWLMFKIRPNQKELAGSTPVFFFVCALLMGLIERVWPMIFPWHLGYGVLFTKLEISQLAEFVGFQGLSSLFFLLNAVFATGVWYLQNQKPKRGWVLIISGVMAFFFANVAGSLIRPKVETTSERSLKFLIVQANIGQADKIVADLANKNQKKTQEIYGEVQEVILQKHIDLTNEALAVHPDAQVIVWPETAIPDFLDLKDLSKPRPLKLRQQIMSWKRALITGAYSQDEKRRVYNALFVFNDKGELADSAFRKSELLAFGEYLPLGETFPFLYQLLPFVSSFGRGPGPEIKTFNLGNESFKAAPQICYESLDDSFARRGALKGADFLVNITNDSWFGTLSEPFQHGTMNWARALETRRPLIRSTNTGQSSIILASGKVVLASPLHEEWYGMATVPLANNSVTTAYMRWGYLDWVLYIVVLLSLLIGVRARHV